MFTGEHYLLYYTKNMLTCQHILENIFLSFGNILFFYCISWKKMLKFYTEYSHESDFFMQDGGFLSRSIKKEGVREYELQY